MQPALLQAIPLLRFLMNDAAAMRLRRAVSNARIARCLHPLLAACIGCVLAWPLRASAQSDDRERAASARALFVEGVELTDQNRWDQAADRFRRALALRDSPVIAYNLASALEHLGQLVEASELLRGIANNPAVDRDLRRSAESTLDEIAPRVARVMVHAPGRSQGDHITLDDKLLLDAQLDVAVPADPGVHVVRAERNGEQLDRQTLELAEGYTLEITLDIPRAPPPREVAALAQPASTNIPAATRSDSDRDEEPPLLSRWYLWAGAGALVVGAIVTTVLLTSSSGGTTPPTPGDISVAGQTTSGVKHVKVKQ
jgi:hypothetical protein